MAKQKFGLGRGLDSLMAGASEVMSAQQPSRIDENVKPLGVESVDYAIGEMTDAAAVGTAMEGCDAVVHAAAVVALDRKRADEVLRANPEGARVVLGTAVERNLDPIIYVSSVSALFSPGATIVHADLPPAQPAGAYGRSKAEAEAYVHGLCAKAVCIRWITSAGASTAMILGCRAR